MYLIVTVDDRNGMMFNKRRQSRDRILCQKILSLTDGAKLWMNGYTAALFKDCAEQGIVVDDNFLSKAGKDDYCFAENVLPDETDVEKIIVFKWNRKYPGDFFFDFDISSRHLTYTEDFVGSSHENITMEVYEK
ncbi:MAG: ribonuclease Z [Clostridiales bacterium]|nr:ribonuclease Z [Clostridiales bacterium]